jgi:hypothetical protein
VSFGVVRLFFLAHRDTLAILQVLIFIRIGVSTLLSLIYGIE